MPRFTHALVPPLSTAPKRVSEVTGRPGDIANYALARASAEVSITLPPPFILFVNPTHTRRTPLPARPVLSRSYRARPYPGRTAKHPGPYEEQKRELCGNRYGIRARYA